MSKQPDKPLCRYHAQGVCRLGSQCAFTHALPAKGQDNVCQFYLAGACAYGAKCRYDHVRPKKGERTTAAPPVVLRRHPDAARPTPQATGADAFPPRSDVASGATAPAPVAAAAVVGSRPWAAVVGPPDVTDTPDVARLRLEDGDHDGEDNGGSGPRGDAPGAAAFDPWRALTVPAEDGTSSDATLAAAANKAAREAALARSREVECCVCLEAVLQKPQAAHRRFGLLSGCSHAFCVSCIRDWRAGGVADVVSAKALDHARTCPVCRSPSHYVIPSSTWPADDAEKAALVDAYKARLAAIPCRHFDDGRGSCPFGTSCWYAHKVNGVDVNALPLRKAGTADGDLRVVEPVRLAAFLER